MGMTARPLAEPLVEPRRILILCTRRLGDVLLTTALIRSLRRAYPGAELHALTLRWSAPALEGNPDLQHVKAITEGAGVRDTLRVLGALRSYDLAVSTLYNDRPHALAFLAGRQRVNLVTAGASFGERMKRRLSTRYALMDPAYHIVVQYLRLADCLGIPRHFELVPPRTAARHPALDALPRRYAVVHAAPMFRYKRWHDAGWRQLVDWLAEQGLPIVLTGGPADDERRYVAGLAASTRARPVNLAGQLGFSQLTALIERAAIYVGPDTSVTHLAAATGAPTVAVYGPTGPVIWGPWPAGVRDVSASPWRMDASLQTRGNVTIVQGVAHCVPCQLEGCENHRRSRSECLDALPVSRVISAVAQALTSSGPTR